MDSLARGYSATRKANSSQAARRVAASVSAARVPDLAGWTNFGGSFARFGARAGGLLGYIMMVGRNSTTFTAFCGTVLKKCESIFLIYIFLEK